LKAAKASNLSLLRGVGPKMLERLHRLGIQSIQDLLFHLPLRYEDRTRVVPIADLRPGDQSVIEGEIQEAQLRMGRRRSLLVALADGSGSLLLRFFHFTQAQQRSLIRGTRLRCFGQVRMGPQGLELVHPEYHLLGAEQGMAQVEDCLTPIYPTTEGLHQLSWRGLTGQALALLGTPELQLQELLPKALLDAEGLPPLADALRFIHRPTPEVSPERLQQGNHAARQRLVLEELIAHQLSLRQLRQRQKRKAAPRMQSPGKLERQLLASLPFSLTQAQQRVLAEIERDMDQPWPMLRLVQGDVGCGKTIVAALAALQVLEAGYQVALMAPTELLAEQHWRNFSVWLEPMGISLGFLSSRIKGKERKAQLAAIASGEQGLVLGTHALVQETVNFARLGLVIIDEQHRFGVHQRLILHEKSAEQGLVAHQLVMTATPIPRTLAMTAYADLDLSVIDELPPGRTPVNTRAMPDTKREEIIARIEQACLAGRQAYWVCTLIEESEVLECQAAEATATELAQALPSLAIGLVHGRMKPADKEAVMAAFKAGDLHLLVATTVIEVGVDVPNASLMVIENPERLGLAQLHQLRGRVGRGPVASHCLLLYKPPLSENARARLEVMRQTNDGFVIAQKDLELRGPGEVLGTRQTGAVRMRIADLMQDAGLIPKAQGWADAILNQQPEQAMPLVQRWLSEGLDYGQV
jgi:ATP-dependent DNA helicase RecG